ncbi:MAG: alpha-galactosidase [Clostridiales bacterium]|nr:alpha-galactosidase [Clostridiales bacterium]
MTVNYDGAHKTFTINTDNSTYQMQVDRYGCLLHLYYGRKSTGCMDWLLTYGDRGFSGNPYDAGTDREYSYDYLPQEFPVQGNGDSRSPALEIRDGSGVFGCDLRYKSHEIVSGKYGLNGLPAVYSETEDDDAATLRIILADRRTGVEAELLYGVLPHIDVITRSVILRNGGTGTVKVEKLLSACLDFVSGEYDLITFHGRHTMERIPQRDAIYHGARVIGSRRGMSSHQYNPFLILADRDTTETAGKCWAMQFVYSGGFRAEAEMDQFMQTRLQMGLACEKFSYPLEPGEELQGPEVIMTFSDSGIERLTHSLHRCLRRHVCRGKYRDGGRPVILNSWEASYFDFTGESLLALADQAADLGMDMLVLDDGWFGDRNDDLRALGDWMPNEKKLGMTLGELAEQVNEKGVKFGIWMEPEMVSENSELYRMHPDWALALPGQDPVRARYQLVLDLSRRDVTDFIYDAICSVLDSAHIEYLKWDYNRSISDVYSYDTDDQGKVMYDYMLGLYSILGRLTDKYPDLLIEGCSGGGGRFDAGMLYYTPQIWCSDNTDALDRLAIQYGTSFGYPSSAVGAHVSACPNHQTGRTTPLSTRAAVAMSGTFGYELDPAKLSAEEKEEIRSQVRTFREYSSLVNNGLYYRLSGPENGEAYAWSHVAEDGSVAMITAVITRCHGNMASFYVVPRGLTSGALYREKTSGRIYPADALMDSGLPLDNPVTDGQSYFMVFERMN